MCHLSGKGEAAYLLCCLYPGVCSSVLLTSHGTGLNEHHTISRRPFGAIERLKAQAKVEVYMPRQPLQIRSLLLKALSAMGDICLP